MKMKLEMRKCWITVSGESATPEGDGSHTQTDYTSYGLKNLSPLHWWEHVYYYAKAKVVSSLPGDFGLPNRAEPTVGDSWLHRDRKYGPAGFLHARRFLYNLENVLHSKAACQTTNHFRWSPRKPVEWLYFTGEEFRIPSWILEKRFIGCIREVYGPILETFSPWTTSLEPSTPTFGGWIGSAVSSGITRRSGRCAGGSSSNCRRTW